MDGFELDMHQRGLHQQRKVGSVGVDEGFERAKAVHDPMWWRRHEQRVTGSCAADPVLRAAEFTGILVLAAALCQQDFVDFADQAKRQRKILAQAGQAMVHGGDVVGDLARVVDRHARGFLGLVQQQIGQGGLSALDLRGQQRLLADIDVEEQGRVRQDGGYAVQPSQGLVRQLQSDLQAGEVNRRDGRQRHRDVGAHRLAGDGGGFVVAQAGGVLGHREALLKDALIADDGIKG